MTSVNKADALSHNVRLFDDDSRIDVHNNSWGPGDTNGINVFGDDVLTRTAISEGVSLGRGGLGIVYVFSSGNEGAEGQFETDYKAEKRDVNVITVGALDSNDNVAPYSDGGQTLFITAGGGDRTDAGNVGGVVTTDREGGLGFVAGNYTAVNDGLDGFSGGRGTSFAAPVVSGVVALMLEKNPNLTYRDVQHIIQRTADVPVGVGLLERTGVRALQILMAHSFGIIIVTVLVSLMPGRL